MHIFVGLIVIVSVATAAMLWRMRILQVKQKGIYKREVLRQRKEELANSDMNEFCRTVHLWDSEKSGDATVYVFLQDVRNEKVGFRAALEA